MTEPHSPIRPRRIRFLQLAGFMLFLALIAYLLLGTMDFVGAGGIVTALYTVTALLLMLFVVAALFFVFCYLNPKLGERVARRSQYLEDAWGVPFRHLGLGSFGADSGREEKTLATRRKQARAERRRYARHAKRGE